MTIWLPSSEPATQKTSFGVGKCQRNRGLLACVGTDQTSASSVDVTNDAVRHCSALEPVGFGSHGQGPKPPSDVRLWNFDTVTKTCPPVNPNAVAHDMLSTDSAGRNGTPNGTRLMAGVLLDLAVAALGAIPEPLAIGVFLEVRKVTRCRDPRRTSSALTRALALREDRQQDDEEPTRGCGALGGGGRVA